MKESKLKLDWLILPLLGIGVVLALWAISSFTWAKGVIGTNNLDANSRLCMASAASAYRMAFGADAPPTCYDDIELAECWWCRIATIPRKLRVSHTCSYPQP